MRKQRSLFFTFLVTATMAAGLSSCQPAASSGPGGSSSIIEDDEEYIVKFNNNFDGTVIKVTVKAGEKVSLPENPTRPGYIFGGWFMDYRDDCTEQFDAATPITKDLTVYAKWTQNVQEHLVTFHYQDKVTSDLVVVVDHGATVAAPETPLYPDGTMVFTGWYIDAVCSKTYDFTVAVNADLDLYAGWRQSKATVTFNYNYTGAPEATRTVVEIGVPMTAPTEPTREHYDFLGWFDRSVGGEVYDFGQPVASDMTLYAHWEESEFLVSFDANGGTFADATQTSAYIQRGASAASFASELEAKLSFVGHDFKGWFAEKYDPSSDQDATAGKTPADLSSITSATTIYAGWALSSYTVSFDLNYTDAPEGPADQTVKYGKLATEPTTPIRDGYLFGGWFVDAECTEQFTFDMQVTGAMNLYAKWIKEQEQHDPVTVTYYVGSGVYATKQVAFNAAASTNAPSDPTKTNAIFAGWFRDTAFTQKFNMSANLSENVSVYAKFLDRYTFEAEAIDFTGKSGFGTSTSSYEEQMIYDGAYIRGGPDNVSNGFFVRELYYNGATLDFVITSSKAVTDAVLDLRVSSESYRFFTVKEVDNKEYNYLSKDEFRIAVNADLDNDNMPTSWLDYGGLYMPMGNLEDKEDLSDNKTPFEECRISTSISLNEGDNYITLWVSNNNDHGGTFHAEAPIIDCIYLYSDAKLSMIDYEFYKLPGVNMKE